MAAAESNLLRPTSSDLPGTFRPPVSPPSARGDRRHRKAAAKLVEGSSRLVGAAPRVGLLYDERMCAHFRPDGDHEENPERLRAIWRKLDTEGIASRCLVMKAKEAREKYIASVHNQSHVKLMRNISSKEYDSSRNRIAKKFDSIYFNEGSSESAFLAAGSIIEVSEKVAAGELNSAIALVRPPGHHAEHNEAMGFCIFNNVAVGANYLLNERPDLGIKKTLIVDWDAHHGNGTQKMFYNDPRVLFFSVHRFDNKKFYPHKEDASHTFTGEGAGKGFNINVPWEHGECGDADYIAVWDHVLLPVAKAFDADIILLSAGFDAALGDPLGGCCVTPNGYAFLLKKLLGFGKGKIVMALEGGYDVDSLANSVSACAKVLLGDMFEYKAPEMQPFISTWRIIQMVRDELKRYWPVLSRKLPENVPLRSMPSDIQISLSKVKPRKGKKIVPPAGTVQNLDANQLNKEQAVAPSSEIVPTTATVQNLDENEISQEQAADSPLALSKKQREERENLPPASNVDNVDEIGVAEDTHATPDSSDGATRFKLFVPDTYQGTSVLEGSDIHGFATADELRQAINANEDCLTEGQVVALLHNLPVFQFQDNFPDADTIQKGAVVTVSEDDCAQFPVTVKYSTVHKILKEHGPKKLEISGIRIYKFEVKGNLWTRSRYTIDKTCYVIEWSELKTKEQVIPRMPRVSNADVVASNNRLVEALANAAASNNKLVDVVAASTSQTQSSTNLVESIDRLVGVIDKLAGCIDRRP